MSGKSDGEEGQTQKGVSESALISKESETSSKSHSAIHQKSKMAANSYQGAIDFTPSSNNSSPIPKLMDLTVDDNLFMGKDSNSEVLVSKLKKEPNPISDTGTIPKHGQPTLSFQNTPSRQDKPWALSEISKFKSTDIRLSLPMYNSPSASNQSTPARSTTSSYLPATPEYNQGRIARSRLNSASTDISISDTLTTTHLLDQPTIIGNNTPTKRKLPQESPANQQQAQKRQCQSETTKINDPNSDHESGENQATGSYSSAAKYPVVYIIPEDESEITQAQSDHIRDSLISLLYPEQTKAPAPAQFHQYGLTKSVFKITCVNNDSVEWIMAQTKNIPPLDSMKFKPARYNELPKLFCFTAYFPRKSAHNVIQVRKRIARSNPQLNPKCWKVYWAHEKEYGLQMCYGIPLAQFKLLEAIDFCPFFELSRIEMKYYRYYLAPPGCKKPPPTNRPPPITKPPQASTVGPHTGSDQKSNQNPSNATKPKPQSVKNQLDQTNWPALSTNKQTPNKAKPNPHIAQSKLAKTNWPNESTNMQASNQNRTSLTEEKSDSKAQKGNDRPDCQNRRPSHKQSRAPPPPLLGPINSPPVRLMSLQFDGPPIISTQHARRVLLPEPQTQKPVNTTPRHHRAHSQ